MILELTAKIRWEVALAGAEEERAHVCVHCNSS